MYYEVNSSTDWVIFLHGNSGCKLDAYKHYKMIASLNLNMFSYDAAGCGKSEGDYLSIG